MINRDIVNMLSKSKRMIGEVNPIIVDYDGEVLSGVHRKQAGWLRVHKVDSRELAEKWEVTPLMAKDMVRVHLNVQRKPSKKETEFLLRRMALCLKEKGIPEEKIASELTKYVPYSQKYILELLPEKYKAKTKVEAGKVAASVRLNRTKPKVQASVIKPPETWEYRKARMHPKKSRMEVEAITELMTEGLPLEMDREFCLQSTIPDGYHPGKDLAIYIDGPVHEGREDRDERLRELLRKRHGCQVLVLRYEGYSKSAKEEIKQQIREAVLG